MTADEDFENFYEGNILPVMEDLKYQSKQTGPWMVMGIISVMLIFISLSIGSVNELNNYGVLVVILLITFAIAIYNYYKKKTLYEDEYKSAVIEKIIHYVSPGMTYKPRHFLDEEKYDKSSLFRRYYDSYTGGDFIEGSIDGVHFRCSELYTHFESGTTRRVRDMPIFKGLFFVIDINKRFTGGTYIWASGEEQIPESIYSEHYRMMPMPEITLLEFNDAEFDNYFSAYTTYVSQAVEIVTPELRRQLITLRESIQVNFSISFVTGECFIAIPFETGLLEPPPNMDEIKVDIYYDFRMVQKIVNTVRCLNFHIIA